MAWSFHERAPVYVQIADRLRNAILKGEYSPGEQIPPVRQLAVTAAAESQGTNVNRLSKDHLWDMKGYRSSWWWLRGEDGEKSVLAPIVTADGVISPAEKEVNRPGGAIRPVIWVRIPAQSSA